jgi:mannosyltransferase
VLTGSLLLLALILRAWPRSALWFDEAQSVAFARESYGSIPHALRQDGAPPLYYLLLKAWMSMFGDGTNAVRSLSVVLSMAALITVTLVARSLWNSMAALAVLVLVATNPFAVRYASETRMYSLVMLEVSLGLLAFHRWGRSPEARRSTAWLVLLALCATALLYTHYWSLYLIAVVMGVLVVGALIQPSVRRRWLAAAVAIAVGGLLWLPWVSTFRFQSDHTATPWARVASLGSAVEGAKFDAGQGGVSGTVLGLAWLVVVVLAFVVWLRRADRSRPPLMTGLIAIAVLGPIAAVIGGHLSSSAYALRYTAVFFPFAMLVLGAAIASFRTVARAGALVFIAVLGTVISIDQIGVARTRAPVVADALRGNARAGDVVLYCPDQLGPALHRVLAMDDQMPALREVVFPAGDAERVDWVDYSDKYAAAAPAVAAAQIDRTAGTSTIWLVSSTTYPPTQPACIGLFDELAELRPTHREWVADDPSIVDHGALVEFEPPA